MPAQDPQAPSRSYVHGVSDIPLTGVTAGQLLRRASAGLIALGLEPGDRIGVWAPSMAEWVVLQFDGPVARRVETVGRALRHTEIKVTDAEGRVAPRGVPGELLTRGCCVMPKYWNDPEKTAAAIGAPDERYGENVCAWIKLRRGHRATADDIRDFCRGKIAHFKIPRYVRFVEDFPMTITGKVQKYIMREEMARELPAQEGKHGRSG